jgi:hypothetical protein
MRQRHARFNVLPDKSGVPAATMRLDFSQYQGAPNQNRGWNSLYSPRFCGILQILNFSESTQIYGKIDG